MYNVIYNETLKYLNISWYPDVYPCVEKMYTYLTKNIFLFY